MTTTAIWIVLSYIVGLFTGFAVGINEGINKNETKANQQDG